MKKLLHLSGRFIISLGLLSLVFLAAEDIATFTDRRPAQHERAMKESETCGGFREHRLTESEAWPVLPSEREWVRVNAARGDDFSFHPELPMCRYQGERGCWIPLTAYTAPCSKVFPNGMPKE